tara:strand:- start:3685 stop:5430 length:1746 start_codon:yes stop_codon:yes gene_type:complete
MPKIPTYDIQGRITSETGSTGTVPSIKVTENIFRTVEPVTDFLTKEYIQEKKLEADNKAYQLLSDMYIDQKDKNGTVVQKGLFTIQSETKENGNPSDAALMHDQEVNNLYNYFKNNKFNDINNFTKKAIEKKFYSTAGILKTKALEGSRLKQITVSKDVDEDYISKEALVLKDVKTPYIPIYIQKVTDKINSNTNYDEGQKKILIKAYTEFGITTLAESMATSEPFSFKEAVEAGKFDLLSAEQKITLSATADENILQSKFQVLTGSLDLPPDAAPALLSRAYDEIAKGTFGGNQELVNLYNSLSQKELTEFKTFFNKKARAKRTDMQFSILAQNQIIQSEVAQQSKEILLEIDKKNGVLEKQIDQLFGETPVIIEQFKELNEKVVNSKGKSISSFDTNSKIINLIINDEINQVSDKFLLPGETGEGKSILQRYENGVNLKDLTFLSSIIDSQNKNPETYSEMKTFFEFIDYYKMPVQGSPVLVGIDSGLDDRLNNFKYVMYSRYINGIKNGIPAKTLTDPTKKEFIGKDVLNFMPNANKIFKEMIDQIKKNKSFDLKTDAKRLPGESTQDYLIRIGLATK